MKKEEERYALAYVTMLYNKGHFVLEASVVDESGRALPDFTVVYPWPCNDKGRQEAPDPKLVDMSNRLLNVSDELANYHKWSSYKDGKFHLDLKYASISMFWVRVVAKGFYDAEVYIRHPLSDEEDKALILRVINAVKSRSAAVLPKEILVKMKLSIMLRKKPKTTTKLERWNVDLRLDKKGERKFWQWLPNELWYPGQSAIPKRRLPTKEEELPKGSLFFTVDKNKDGSFAVLDLSKEPNVYRVFPTGVKIGIKGAPGDGLIRYQPKRQGSADKSIRYAPEPVRRGMGLAPEKGYLPDVSLSADDLRSSDSEAPMFYLKLRGRYGRALFSGIEFNEDRSDVTLHLELEWQPDGSRNLETGE